jgi:hypothetical protein
MPRLPFDDIQDQANKLLDKALFAKTEDEAHEAYSTYLAYLDAVGWDAASFDSELAKRVDQLVPPEEWKEPDDPFKLTPKKILN